MLLCGANAFFDETPSDNAYVIGSYSLLITSSGTPGEVQRIRNPSNSKNSDLEGFVHNETALTNLVFFIGRADTCYLVQLSTNCQSTYN